MEEELLDEVDEKIAELGKPIAEFAVRGRIVARNLVIALALLLLGVFIEFGVFWARGFNHTHVVVIGIFLIMMAIMLVVRVFLNFGLRVLVFPEGMVRLWRGEGQAVFWEEVEKIWKQKIEGHAARAWQGGLVLKIQRNDGSTVQFDDSLPGLDKLSQIVQRQTLPYLLHKAVGSFQTGASLDFGKLRLEPGGIKQGNESISWADIQEVRFSDTQVAFYKKGKWSRWCQVPVADIPNAFILPEFLAQVAAIKVTRT